MSDELLGSADAPHGIKVFISYSRVDLEFATRIVTALEKRGFEVLTDFSGIEPSEKWWQRIEQMITQADTVVCVLSPDAIASKVCTEEVEFAGSLNKRYVPIVCRRVHVSDVPEVLRELNWLLFDDPQRFDQSVIELVNALERDIQWIRRHTEFTEFARRWYAAGRPGPGGLMLRPPLLAEAEAFLTTERPAKTPEPMLLREFVAVCRRAFDEEQARARRIRVVIYGLVAVAIVALVGWIKHSYIGGQWVWYTVTRPFAAANIWPHVLTRAGEQALKPGDEFRECSPRQQDKDYCPDMVVVPAGSFLMGSLRTDKDAQSSELPQHRVTITKPLAVSKFELTFAEWDACVAGGGCNGFRPNDALWGRGEEPVVNVSFDDAQAYATWLASVTGKPYRLLSEAEYEFATRAGATTAFPWGNDVGDKNASCDGCGTELDRGPTVGRFTRGRFVSSFAPNAFGLNDMVGNVWEWTEDCYHSSYLFIENPELYRDPVYAPTDGSPWISGDCDMRVVRGGSWLSRPDALRSANREWKPSRTRDQATGFRVARTLLEP